MKEEDGASVLKNPSSEFLVYKELRKEKEDRSPSPSKTGSKLNKINREIREIANNGKLTSLLSTLQLETKNSIQMHSKSNSSQKDVKKSII